MPSNDAIRECDPDRATCSNLHVIVRRGARYNPVIDTLSSNFKPLVKFSLQQTQRCRRFPLRFGASCCRLTDRSFPRHDRNRSFGGCEGGGGVGGRRVRGENGVHVGIPSRSLAGEVSDTVSGAGESLRSFTRRRFVEGRVRRWLRIRHGHLRLISQSVDTIMTKLIKKLNPLQRRCSRSEIVRTIF